MTMADYSDVDYMKEAVLSIALVENLSKDQQVQLNPRQCEYLSEKLTETACFLRAKSGSLIAISARDDRRRNALLHLHFAVKRAEKLVRGCCCEWESWLESAVTLADIKEDIVDILLDVRWWTSMTEIAIASVSSGQEMEVELLRCAEDDYTTLLKYLHRRDNDLQWAAKKDKELLSEKVRDLETSYVGIDRTAEQNHDDLLVVYVRSRLENSELETKKELNVYEFVGLIGMGSFGAVMKVKWLGCNYALKMLKYKCEKEATSLRECHHPYIVKFFRYWEAAYGEALPESTPYDTPHASSSSRLLSDNSSESKIFASKSHILMELMPTDLGQHMQGCVKMQHSRGLKEMVGSKRRPLAWEVDVAINVMLQISKAVSYMHNKGIVHRDLKPSNVLVRVVSEDEVPELSARGYLQVKLADFGLAKSKALSYANTTMTSMVGTKLYGAPEVFTREKYPGGKFPLKADVWSFGIMCSEILSGKPPFAWDIDNGMAGLQRRIRKGLRPQVPENCPGYLKFIISSCLQLHPQERPNFSDLLRLVRLAHARSLGLIQEDYDLFTYKTRLSVRSLHPLQRSPTAAPIFQFPAPLMRPWLLNISSLKIRKAVLFFSRGSGGLRRSRDGSLKVGCKSRKMNDNFEGANDLLESGEEIAGDSGDASCTGMFTAASKVRKTVSAGDASRIAAGKGSKKFSWSTRSKATLDCQAFGYVVNQVWPPNCSPYSSDSKMDVIFFEGNVGRRKYMSCKDTWVQRGKPNVQWPRDWLPKDLGVDIRVLLLEYSISEDGVEGVLDELLRLLVFSDRWNRGHSWQRPIVLVGHSLGCIIIEHLVVALDKRARSIQNLEDENEIGLAKVAKAFLESLTGCFFYAPPWSGLVPREDLLKHVFGGLSYSRSLFPELLLDSPKLKLLSEDFMRVRSEQMKLMAIVEGFHTRGIIIVPRDSMQDLRKACKVVRLEDSNHTDVCKPTNKRHRAYRELLKFTEDILKEPEAIQCPSNDKQPARMHKLEVFEKESLVNQVWPLENSFDCESTKLDIIFFEGNVGERKFMSTRDTWVQRGNSSVCWPQEWLPIDLGGDVRVLLLKYCVSDSLGIEGIVDDLQENLIFSDRWNRNHQWENPIVLVGHSIGCVVIQDLVVRLHHMTQLIHNTADDSVKMQANTSRAFMKNLNGCFFYAPPLQGFVPSESVLSYVFGGLSFSRNIFWDFALGSPKLRKLLEDFMLINTTRRIPVSLLLEGKKTREEMVVVAPLDLMQYVLNDSNHSEVCQPTSKDHRPYKELIGFLSDVLQLQDLSSIDSYEYVESKHSKNSQLTDDSSKDESFVMVVEPKEHFYDDQKHEGQKARKLLEHESKEHQDLYDVLQEKIHEIDNVIEMQHFNASNFYTCKFHEVLLIGNHNDVDDTLVFHFLNGESMAKVVGVGIDYAKIILRNGVDIEIQEVLQLEWEKAWLDSKPIENTTYKTMKVTIPSSNDVGTPHVDTHNEDYNIVLVKPLLWDVARYFTLRKILITLANNNAREGGDVGQLGNNGNRGGSSNDSESTKSLFFYAFQSWFSLQFIKRGGGKDDEDGNGGDDQNNVDAVDGVKTSCAKVKLHLLAEGYSFTNSNNECLHTLISSRFMDLEINWVLEFEFLKNEKVRKISLTMANISFGLGSGLQGNNFLKLPDRFGPYHDKFQVHFGIVNREKAIIDGDVLLHGCEQVKTSYEGEIAKESRKGKQHEVNGYLSGGIHGILSIGGRGGTTFSNSEGSIMTSRVCNEYNSIQTTGGFSVVPTIIKSQGVVAIEYLAPTIPIVMDEIWNKPGVWEDIKRTPLCRVQDVKFSGTWLPTSSENSNGLEMVEYELKAFRRLREINKTEVNSPSSSSKGWKLRRSSKPREARSIYEFKSEVFGQSYEKKLYLNHSMTNLVDCEYTLRERNDNGQYCLTTLRDLNSVSNPLIALSVV